MYHYRSHDGATEEWHFSTEDTRRYRIVAEEDPIAGYWIATLYEETATGKNYLESSCADMDEVDEVVDALMNRVGYINKQ